MPVDDAGAVEIVGGELTADAVSRKDANAEAAHLAGHMPEHHVIVVELYAEHRVGQRLNHLALEFDLIFLCYELHPVRVAAHARRPCVEVCIGKLSVLGHQCFGGSAPPGSPTGGTGAFSA